MEENAFEKRKSRFHYESVTEQNCVELNFIFSLSPWHGDVSVEEGHREIGRVQIEAGEVAQGLGTVDEERENENHEKSVARHFCPD